MALDLRVAHAFAGTLGNAFVAKSYPSFSCSSDVSPVGRTSCSDGDSELFIGRPQSTH